ncbi:MAG: hypothetical protein AB1758_21065 [Candidatus Eremiobacterota bacterium]
MATSSISGLYSPALSSPTPTSANPVDILRALLGLTAALTGAPQETTTAIPAGANAFRQEMQQSLQQLDQGWAGFLGGGTRVTFSAQTPGLTPDQQVVLPKPVQVANGANATQLSTDRVRVLDRNLATPGAAVDAQGSLTGPRGAVQSLVAAENVDSLFREKLGADFRYDTPDGRLSVDLDARVAGPQAVKGGDIQFSNNQLLATADPDVVSHEAGHKLLFSLRPGLSNDLATQSTHEAFGDTVSLFTSLRDPSVRADLLGRLANGNASSLASQVGESVPASERAARGPNANLAGPAPPGVRDLAGPLPRPGNPDPHEAGKPFGKAVFQSVLEVAGALRQGNAAMSPDEALRQANEIVSSDVIRAVSLLPQRGSASPDLMARAVLQTDQRDQGGQFAQILANNFRNTGLL